MAFQLGLIGREQPNLGGSHICAPRPIEKAVVLQRDQKGKWVVPQLSC